MAAMRFLSRSRVAQVWTTLTGLAMLAMVYAPGAQALSRYRGGSSYRDRRYDRDPCYYNPEGTSCAMQEQMAGIMIYLIIGGILFVFVASVAFLVYRGASARGMVRDFFNDGRKLSDEEREILERAKEESKRRDDSYWSQAKSPLSTPSFVQPVGTSADTPAAVAPVAPVAALNLDAVLLDTAATVTTGTPLQSTFVLAAPATVSVDVAFIGCAVQIAVGDSTGWLSNVSAQEPYQGTLELPAGTWHIYVAQLELPGVPTSPSNVAVRVNGPGTAAQAA